MFPLHLGKKDKEEEKITENGSVLFLSLSIILRNVHFFLFQVQATVVGFLAAVAAVILGWIPEGKYRFDHSVLLCSSSVATAFIASLLQGKRSIYVTFYSCLVFF